ncbi:MarR family transcriptional regulator [Hymenobacter busanensis]|uniref:MarR family transcriptional regulator n=1 Tax=Hymenobacter busanensis TaxID=2607656 RepID=A0A7L5A0Y3_9BACT|nr:MarR family transcriptional regulator [Hymenobacter busanensis]KAA9338142.1 MarR family transcriptional regulator [Hymenobacter busanensis]QHJ09434.1 MarR family transcriptional regulator [Hymenobacter busanensis]
MPLPTDPLFTFEGPDDNPGFLLAQAAANWQRQLGHTLEPMNLTPTQFLLLASVQRLSHDNPAVTQAAVSQHARTDKMTVSKTLRALEEKGFLTRPAHEQDARARNLTLTAAGLKAVVRAAWALEEFDQRFFGADVEKLMHTLQPLAHKAGADEAKPAT